MTITMKYIYKYCIFIYICYVYVLSIYLFVCLDIYIYTKIKKPKTRCVGVNIKQKNTFSIVTSISVALHNLLQCV